MRDYYDIDLALDNYIEKKREGKEIKDYYLKVCEQLQADANEDVIADYNRALKNCKWFFGEDFMANDFWEEVDNI